MRWHVGCLCPPEDIMSWLRSLEMPLEVVGASVETLCRLGRAQAMKDTQVSCSEEVPVCSQL